MYIKIRLICKFAFFPFCSLFFFRPLWTLGLHNHKNIKKKRIKNFIVIFIFDNLVHMWRIDDELEEFYA